MNYECRLNKFEDEHEGNDKSTEQANKIKYHV